MSIKLGANVKAEITAYVRGMREYVTQGDNLRVRLLKVLLASKSKRAAWDDVVKEVREAIWCEFCAQSGISEDTRPRHTQAGWPAINSSLSEVRKVAEKKELADAVIAGELTISGAIRKAKAKAKGDKPKGQASKLEAEVQARPIAAAQTLATLSGELDNGTPIAVEAIMEALRSAPDNILSALVPLVSAWVAEAQVKLGEVKVEANV